jgi:multidrug efflux pump
MKLSHVSIQRPVFATVMSLAIVLFGIISFTQLPVREYPDIDPPIISIVTLYRGASSNVVETEITDVLEEQFATLEGVKTITSSSTEGGSVITIEFELNRDVNEAANDVRDRVSRIRGTLPQEIEDQVISKVDANAQAIVWLAVFSQNYSTLELSDFADRVLKEKFSGFRCRLGYHRRRTPLQCGMARSFRMAARGLPNKMLATAGRMLKYPAEG